MDSGWIRRRVYLRPEGWYYVFVIVFVVGGAVLRNVNVLVALAGLMAAALILHWQLVLRSLSGLTIVRSFPPRISAGEGLEVEVSILHRHLRGTVWALEYTDQFQRLDPPDDHGSSEVRIIFPRVSAGDTAVRRYRCQFTQRGVYRFSKARLASRYPLGLVEGVCLLDMPDRLVVFPAIGKLSRRWTSLIEADQSGQQSTRHRRGTSEGDFYALREWRNGDNRCWIHWRTSAKLGTLAVRQFEQRRSSNVALLLDLHLPADATSQQRVTCERAISLAATAIADLSRHGGAQLALVIASRELGEWSGNASPLFAQELLEHLAVCRGGEGGRLADATQRLTELQRRGARLVVISTRSQQAAANSLDRKTRDSLKWAHLAEAVWLDGSAGEFDSYFTLEAIPHA